MTERGMRDLFVVVADLDAENAIATLLTSRQEALGITLDFNPERPPRGDMLRYSGRDSGCYNDAADILRPPQRTHRHALICFDLHGSGAEQRSREEIEDEIEERLNAAGWAEGDAVAIAISPELESWVWADSPEVADVLGWGRDMEGLRRHLQSQRVWTADMAKPVDPKETMRRALREKRCPRSARLFSQLAQTVSLSSCIDPAFVKFRTTLQRWFPQ